MATITVAMETMANSFSGSQNPKASNTYDLGNNSLKWRTLFTENISINGRDVPVKDIAYVGSPTIDPLLKTGGVMSGDISWTQTGKGITWGMNTDGAGIRFNNQSDSDTNSFLEFYTYDNGNEHFKWTHRSSGSDEYKTWMELKSDGLRVNGKKVYTEGSPLGSGSVDAIGPKGNWTTNGGQDLLVHGKRALVGFANGELHLGYGGDFTSIKCGANYEVWHSGNLNDTATFRIGAIRSRDGGIYLNNRYLYVGDSAPSVTTDGTIWIK